MPTQTATLAGGCFWCIETVFNRLRGVESAVSGYMGGHTQNPTYQDICNGDTGHAEVVQVTFDPDVISFRDLLDVFFTLHDPTQLNRQGPDRGASYRSEIFAATPAQLATAKAYIAQLEAARIFPARIVTKISARKGFYWAETEHQDYLVKNPNSSYIRAHDLPKLAALKQVWPQFWREDPVLLAQTRR